MNVVLLVTVTGFGFLSGLAVGVGHAREDLLLVSYGTVVATCLALLAGIWFYRRIIFPCLYQDAEEGSLGE